MNIKVWDLASRNFFLIPEFLVAVPLSMLQGAFRQTLRLGLSLSLLPPPWDNRSSCLMSLVTCIVTLDGPWSPLPRFQHRTLHEGRLISRTWTNCGG